MSEKPSIIPEALSGNGMAVIDALKIKEKDLADRLHAILECRNDAIQDAKSKYTEALKKIKAKQGALNRMMKTATEKL